MRYVKEQTEPQQRTAVRTDSVPYIAGLRHELSERNIHWAQANNLAHEISLGPTPTVLYREDNQGRHGNFYPAAYANIQRNSAWSRRLRKVHTSARKILLSRDAGRCELDSCNSSDALLMSVFCHPQALQPGSQLLSLLGVNSESDPEFGYRPRIPLKNGRFDQTEIDMRFGNLLFEAKLTESNFQTAPGRLVERYLDLDEIFYVEELPRSEEALLSYQLIRGVLAAHAGADLRFCVICDARRPDLVTSWYRILQCVRYPALRCRLMLVTWQEIAMASPKTLRRWLSQKYGIECGP